MKNKCNDCIHADVCQYIQEMKHYDEEIDIITDSYHEMLDNQLFDYDIKCEKYLLKRNENLIKEHAITTALYKEKISTEPMCGGSLR